MPPEEKRQRKKETRPRRPGGGRKKKTDKPIDYSVKITPAQAQLLKTWGGGDVSAGLRWLISTTAPLIGPSVVVYVPRQ